MNNPRSENFDPAQFEKHVAKQFQYYRSLLKNATEAAAKLKTGSAHLSERRIKQALQAPRTEFKDKHLPKLQEERENVRKSCSNLADSEAKRRLGEMRGQFNELEEEYIDFIYGRHRAVTATENEPELTPTTHKPSKRKYQSSSRRRKGIHNIGPDDNSERPEDKEFSNLARRVGDPVIDPRAPENWVERAFNSDMY